MPALPERARRRARIENEAHKAVLFASQHGGWPIDLSPDACAHLARLPQADELQRRWGELDVGPLFAGLRR